MTTVLERLRTALLPNFYVEREIGGGGMGRVFLAQDRNLERPVAVKIIRPELATAQAAERFLSEARTLARLSHQHVVPVHQAGEAAGFLYYVMDYIEGETLAERLRRGPLSVKDTVALGLALLDALNAVHRAGIVHRDIKPGNIFFSEGKPLLGDFGISTSVDSAAGRKDAPPAGTPGYMPPEQWFGWGSTPASDLYAVGMVLYEALTGRRWTYLLPDQPPDWSGVPVRLERVLEVATQWEPARRWASAADFRRALAATQASRVRRAAPWLTAGLTVVVAVAWWMLRPPKPPLDDLTILPFSVGPGVDSIWRVDPPTLISQSIAVPELMPLRSALRLEARLGGDTAAWFGRLGTRAVLGGFVRRDRGGYEVRLRVLDARGGRQTSAPIRGDSLVTMGCLFAQQVVHLVWPARETAYECPGWLKGERARGEVAALLNGERAFRREAWDSAETYFARALQLDPGFAIAAWRLANAQAWQRKFTGVDLEALCRLHRDELSEEDQLLLEAWCTPFGWARIALYQTAVRQYSRDPYTWLAYGDNLFNRGALLGIPLDSSRRVLGEATALDSTLGPAYLDLAWAAIRLGQRRDAAEYVRRLTEISPPNAVIPPDFLALAYTARFAPDSIQPYQAQLAGAGEWSTEADAFVGKGLRWGLAFDLAAAEAEFAGQLLSLRAVPRERRVDLLVARGLGEFATGRPLRALASLDSAAVVDGSPAARLHAAEWRVIPAALGIPGIPPEEVRRGREELATLTAIPDLAVRSAWALAIDAAKRADSLEFEQWASRVAEGADTAAADLSGALRAVAAANRGNLADAIALSDPLVPRVAAEEVPDPFYRTTLAILRGSWRHELGQRPDGDWMWYENADLDAWPSGLAQAGEVDWAAGAYARYLLGKAELARGNRAQGCRLLRRVNEIWSNVEPGLAAARADLDDALGRCPS